MVTTAQRIAGAKTYGVGTKAYIDTFPGLVACVVISIHKPGANGIVIGHDDELTVKVTKTKCGYKKGEIVTRSAAYTPPRQQLFRRGHSYRIKTAYKYV